MELSGNFSENIVVISPIIRLRRVTAGYQEIVLNVIVPLDFQV